MLASIRAAFRLAGDRIMSRPSVAALVLSYNGREVVLEALTSLSALDYERLELVVIDNGSTDGTAETIRRRFPQVTLVTVPENRGIPWGMNHGIRYAVEQGHDYLLLLNNDIEAAPDLVERLLEVAEADPTVACVGPKTYYYWERERLWSAGGRIRFREAVTSERGMGQVDRGQFDGSEEVDYINGCCALVSRRVMEEVGPWDPVFHVSVEDADWCLRARARGYRCIYAHRAILWHMVSRSTGGYKASRTFHTARSTALFVRRHGNWRQRLSFWLFFALSIPAAWLRELPRRNTAAVWAKVRGAREGWRVPLPDPPRL